MNTVNREFACDDAKIPDVSDSYRLDGCGIDLTPVCPPARVVVPEHVCWKLNCLYCVYVTPV